MAKKTYKECVNEVARKAVIKNFNDRLGGSLNPTNGAIDSNVALLAFIFGMNPIYIRSQVDTLIKEKEKDLKENWEKALTGTYKFA